MSRLLLMILLSLNISAPVFAQYRCVVDGKSIVQSDPCVDQNRPSGQFRCFVDGQVVYSNASCTTIKSKEILAREAKEAEAADNAKRKVEAARLEAADRPNFERRIQAAQRVTARHLRDPGSARFDRSFVSWYSGYAVVCGFVAGRNGFGGYAQPVRFVTWDDWVTIDDGKSYKEFDKHWDKHCGPL